MEGESAIIVNGISGLETKVVMAKIVTEVEFIVGGEDDEDRDDSVRMLFDDHYDDIVKCSFFSNGIKSMFLDSVEVVNGD